jgi:hypothetical protein
LSGKIVINRDFLSDELFNSDPATQREAWLDLIGQASGKDRKYSVNKVWVNLKRGEVCVSERYLSERWQWSKSKVHRFLIILAENGRIEPRSGPRNELCPSIISICKYNEIMDITSPIEPQNEPQNEPRADHERTTSGPKQTPYLTPYLTPDVTPAYSQHTREAASVAACQPRGPFESQGTPDQIPKLKNIPPGWVPDEPNRQFARMNTNPRWTDDAIDRNADEFRDHYLAKPANVSDWDAMWRKWVRNSGYHKHKFTSGSQSGSRDASTNPARIAAAEIAAGRGL